MSESASMNELEDFALDCLNAANHPEYEFIFNLYGCHSCGEESFSVVIEHHTGSEEWDFKGIIWGSCLQCGYLGRLFTFTGEHREHLRDERPECDCGNRSFMIAQCDRIEGDQGIPGFFDEGVIVGKCISCQRNKVLVRTD